MPRTFQEKVHLAIEDPSRIGRFAYYRSLNLLRWATGLGTRPERLDEWLDAGRSGGSRHVAAATPADTPAPAADALERIASARERVARQPLMRDTRTYNPAHPDFHPRLTRYYPGRIFNRWQTCANPAYAALKHLAWLAWVPDRLWAKVLADAMAEASAVPGAEQVFERRRFVENYVGQLGRTYRSVYQPGWVNLDDALFLYWLVRQARPKTIVQTGVCNGLSAAFMMLALAKNGPEGSLHVIDIPPVFDPNDPAWTVPGEVYGVVIPEGKTAGWLVPDAYRDRFEVWNGDAKDLLPKMVDKVAAIDFFYHDSDHTYDHMMLEFREAKRKLSPGGLMVGDDIGWNTSLWDFADKFGVPSYNFKGTVGVAFF